MTNLQNPVMGAKLFKWPKGTITQLFGANVVLYQKAIGTNGHNGIDIVAAEGTPILASQGTICEVKNTPEGYGKHIRILTEPDIYGDYLELTFGHLRDIIVNIGDKVIDGQMIGGMGNTGFVISGSTQYWGNAPAGRGVHLHWGARECNLKNTGWQTQYSSGKTAYIKNYNNGMKGAVDPMPLLEQWIKNDLQKQVNRLTQIVELYKRVLNLLNLLKK